jgi:SNF2 family DNA or RNA helicase
MQEFRTEPNLNRHQKKGLTFMLQREVGQQYGGSQDDLWVKETSEFGHTMWVVRQYINNYSNPFRYTNTITEMSQSGEPPDSRGGLLADQMGLGKSLTMISLIALNRGRATGLIHTEQGLIRRINSTLVVLPYPRELHIWKL